MKSKNTDHWTALLQESIGARERRPTGPGWERREDIAKRLKLTDTAARRFFNAALKAKRIERFEGCSKNENGRCVRAIWFRPLK